MNTGLLLPPMPKEPSIIWLAIVIAAIIYNLIQLKLDWIKDKLAAYQALRLQIKLLRREMRLRGLTMRQVIKIYLKTRRQMRELQKLAK